MIPVGERWHFRFQLDPFPRQQRSTKEPLRNRVKAEQVAREKFEAAKLRARGEEPEPILRDAVAMWVEAHLLRKSASHIANVERFGRLHLGELAELKLTQLTTERVENELNRFLATHGKSTANNWLTYLRLVCKWAIRRRMIRALPFDVPEVTFKSKRKPLMPMGRATDYLARVDHLARRDPAIASVVRILLGIGLRSGEATRARWECMDWERGEYTPHDTKGGEAVPRPLPDWLLDHLRPLAKPYGWMVPTMKGKPVTPTRLIRVMTAACRDLKIPRLTPHCLRHTYATWLSETGVPIQDIQKILEHADINTTAVYLGVDLDRVRRGQARIAKGMGMPGQGSGELHHSKAHGV